MSNPQRPVRYPKKITVSVTLETKKRWEQLKKRGDNPAEISRNAIDAALSEYAEINSPKLPI